MRKRKSDKGGRKEREGKISLRGLFASRAEERENPETKGEKKKKKRVLELGPTFTPRS